MSIPPVPPAVPSPHPLPHLESSVPPPAVITGPNWGLIVLGTLLALLSLGELAHFWGFAIMSDAWLTPETLTAVGVALLGLGLVGTVIGRRRR
ncbi:MAG: hypothetical protein IPM08_06340 [Actinomycetales bacterium]|nr:hypothetical protein [Actinomycetales bacterium]